MEALKCPICSGKVSIILDVPASHAKAKKASCGNEYYSHRGYILYRFLNVLEEAAQPKANELILN